MVKKIVSLLILGALLGGGYDYGKHWWLSHILGTSVMPRFHLGANQIEAVFAPFSSYLRVTDIRHTEGKLTLQTLTLQNDFWDIQKFYIKGTGLSTTTGVTAQTLTLKIVADPLFILRGTSTLIDCRHCVLEQVDLLLEPSKISLVSCDIPWTYNPVEGTLKTALHPTTVTYDTLSLDISGRGDFTNLFSSPEGAFNLNIKGLPDVIHAMQQSGHLSPAQAQTFLFGSALLSGGQGDIPLTLTLRNKTVFLGPIPLYTF